jgi:hypothetical protein
VLFSVARSLMWFNKILSNRVWHETKWSFAIVRLSVAEMSLNVQQRGTDRRCQLGCACRGSCMPRATSGRWHESPSCFVIHLFRNFLCLCFLLPVILFSVLIVLLSFFPFIPILFIFSWDSSVGTVASVRIGRECIHDSILGRGNRLDLSTSY